MNFGIMHLPIVFSSTSLFNIICELSFVGKLFRMILGTISAFLFLFLRLGGCFTGERRGCVSSCSSGGCWTGFLWNSRCWFVVLGSQVPSSF